MRLNRLLFSIYRTIKRNRFKKKLHIYKQVYNMSIDATMLIYLFVVLGYIFTAVFAAGDFTNPLRDGFALVEEVGLANFLAVVSVYPIRYIFQSIRQSGIVFSSSEYQLSILPYGLRDIWNVIVVEKWMKRIVVGLVLWLVLLFTPLSSTLTGAYIFTFIMLDIGMTAPLWRLYQQRLLTKLATLIGAVVFVGVFVYVHFMIASVAVLLSIVIWNVFAWKHLLKQVQWGRVVEDSDHKVWKMPLISSITKVPFKREKRMYVLQKFTFRRKRFTYEAFSIHHRLWHSYMIKNTRVLFQIIGMLLVFMTAMIFVETFIFYISIAISIYIFSSMSASLFYDRFKSDILEVLPWDLSTFKDTYMRWNIYAGLILILPIVVYVSFYFTWWAPIQVALIITVAIYTLHNKLKRSRVLLAKDTETSFVSDALVIVGLVAIVFSGTYPFVSILAIGFGYANVRK